MNGSRSISIAPNLVQILRSLTLLLLACHSAIAIEYQNQNPKTPVSFTRDVAPILAARCQGCHHDTKAAMNFNVTTLNKIKNGSKQTPGEEMIVPGKPDESRLVEVLLADAQPRMPVKLKSLSDREIGIIRDWITQGAKLDSATPDTPLTDIAPPEQVLKIKIAAKTATETSTNQANSKDSIQNATKNAKIPTKPVIGISDDSKTVVVVENQKIMVYDLAKNGQPTKTFGPVPGQAQAVWIAPDQSFVMVAASRPGLEGTVSRWNLATSKQEYATKLHSDQILSMAVSPDRNTIATSSYDKSIALLNVNDGKILGHLKEHTDAVYDVAFSPVDPAFLASASGDRTVKTWDLKSKKRVDTFSDSTAELYAIAISKDGRTVYAGGVDRTLRGWNIGPGPRKIVGSALAHESAINRLEFFANADGKQSELVSMSEDKTMRRWTPNQIKPVGEPIKIQDWVISESINATHFGVALFDGFTGVYRWTDSPQLVWQKPAGQTRGGSPDSFKPELVRFSNLGTPSPRFLVSGQESIVTLTGNDVDAPLKVWVEPSEIAFEIVNQNPPKPNTLQLKLKVPPKSRFEQARIRVATSTGITGDQSIALFPASWKTVEADAKVQTIEPGTLIFTTINRPAATFRGLFEMQANQQLTFELFARRLGSTLSPRLVLKDNQGKIIAQKTAEEGKDPILSYVSPTAQQVIFEITDTQYTGDGNHFAFIQTGSEPVAESAWPVAVKQGADSTTVWQSATGKREEIKSTVAATIENPQRIESQALPPKWIAAGGRSRIAFHGEVAEFQSKMTPIAAPAAVSARFQKAGEIVTIPFQAKSNEPLVIETFARRLGRNTDTLLEITDINGKPVVAATFRKVADTLIAFRDHGSRQKGIRLTQWADFDMADYVLIGREITRIFQLPKNADDDCQFFGDEFRWGYFGTTPEQHSMGQTVTKLEPLSLDSVKSIDPNLLHHVNYVNDDGGATVGNDSFLIFQAPADGTYLAKIHETSRFSGDDAAFALVVRKPNPDYLLQFGPSDFSIPQNGSKMVTISIRRTDGFDGPVVLNFNNLPTGWRATSGVIEAGQLSCDILITPPAELQSPQFDISQWTLHASAQINGKLVEKTVNAGGRGWVITPESNLQMTTSTNRLKIEPGKISTMTLKVSRREPFNGRVPIDVRNLPYGVRVLDIGLNGVLITEPQNDREIRIYCEPWVKPQSRPFFAVGRAESAGTADSSPPVILEIVPAGTTQSLQQAQVH